MERSYSRTHSARLSLALSRLVTTVHGSNKQTSNKHIIVVVQLAHCFVLVQVRPVPECKLLGIVALEVIRFI